MAQLIYVLDVRANDMVVEMAVNDVVVARVDADGHAVEQTVINPYVVSGENTLRATIRPAREGDPMLAYRIVKTARAAGAPETTLLQRDTPVSLPKLPAGAPERPVHDTFRVDEAFGAWAWNRPDAARYGGGDREAVLQVVRRLHEALAARDVNAVLGMMTVKFEELGRALQFPAAELRDDAREHLEYVTSSADWTLAPLRPQELVLRPMAEGRAVAVQAKDGGSPIVSVRGEPFRLDLLLVDLPGAGWTVVR